MASLRNTIIESQIPAEVLIDKVMQIHASISKLESLKPSKELNSLLTQLRKLCTLPSSININALPKDVRKMRESLILLCGRAEGLLEFECASVFTKIPQPLNNLNLLPYYRYYVKLINMEYEILSDKGVAQPKKVAFVGSGPMPLTSIMMAKYHMKSTHFDNYDIDGTANDEARKIVSTDSEFAKRMKFHNCDILEVKEKLGEYDFILLAALAGMHKDEKMKIIGHIRKYMQNGGVLLLRTAKGARAFLYPLVEEHDLLNFEVLSIFHPNNDMIHSAVLVRKPIF
ncbi:Nicotianamine synthase [Melia azedarach]|uniref:Nicotianamine synthase n=1 Tax=Melia azedarach TaxID=155640 RepID=A0ACC1Z0G2_MELAZ|nr:Nicotianamine synthase [Melia azedarach]